MAQAYNMIINDTHLPGAVMNDEALTHKAIAVAQHVGYKVEMMEQPLATMIGEDFSGYSQHFPSVFALIGVHSVARFTSPSI